MMKALLSRAFVSAALLRRSPTYTTSSPLWQHLTRRSMWDERYSEDGFAYGKEPNDFLKEFSRTVKLSPNSKCLFLAEGEGRNAVWMASQGMDVTAMDSSHVGLAKAQKLAKETSVSIQTEFADLAEYDLGENKWDCIVGIFCHVPPPIRERVLGAIPDALKPNGFFVLEAYTPDQIERGTGGPPAKELMYSSDILSQAFKGKLDIIRNEELVRKVVEGKYHNGDASVVQFVGRKAA